MAITRRPWQTHRISLYFTQSFFNIPSQSWMSAALIPCRPSASSVRLAILGAIRFRRGQWNSSCVSSVLSAR